LNVLDDEKLQPCIAKLNRPEARVKFAEELASYSVCAIDVSDGLVADLGHIISASHCGAQVFLSGIPLSSTSRYYFEKYNQGIIDWPMLLTRGDDYELCFTVSEDKEYGVNELARKHALKISCIGEIIETKELNFVNPDGELESFVNTGFKHF
jgi:thiamine-monophosphate kinase